MAGDNDPGITPRGIHELFRVLDRDSGKYSFSVSCYMLELYQDDLSDLLLPVQPRMPIQKVRSIANAMFCTFTVRLQRRLH